MLYQATDGLTVTGQHDAPHKTPGDKVFLPHNSLVFSIKLSLKTSSLFSFIFLFCIVALGLSRCDIITNRISAIQGEKEKNEHI